MLYGSRTRLLNTETLVADAATLMDTGTRNLKAALNGQEHLLHALLNGVEALMVRWAEQVRFGDAANGHDVFGPLFAPGAGRRHRAWRLADLDQNTAGSSTMCGMALIIRFQPKWPEAICRNQIFEVLAFEQTNRDATLAGAHAHRQTAFFVEIGHGHGYAFPHPPGQGGRWTCHR